MSQEPRTLQLTDDQLSFLKRYSLPLSDVFDATGLSKKEYRPMMKTLNKLFAIGVTPCKAAGHTLRTRAGHCLQCKPETITFIKRHYSGSIVYACGSISTGQIKIGCTKDLGERENALKNTEYAGVTDWETIYRVTCKKNAGKIEAEIQHRLSQYHAPSMYKLGGKLISCYEVFACSYKLVKEVMNEIKKEFPEEIQGEDEVKNADERFDFENIRKTGEATRKRTTAPDNTIPRRIRANPAPVRRSPYSDELNQIKKPGAL